MAIINTVIKGGGVTPTGSISITSNGTHDVTNYANANVNVPTTAPAHYIEKTTDASGKLINGCSSFIDMTGVTDIGNFVLAYAYYQNTTISGALNMSSLTALTGSYAMIQCFYGCTGLTSISMSSLTTASGQYAMERCFYGCTGLTSISMPSLTTVSGSSAMSRCFYGCTGLTSISMSSLTALTGSSAMELCFKGCTSLTTVTLGGTTAIDFGTGTNQFQNMFSDCTQNITVNAPAGNQSTIEAMSGYPNFGASGTVTFNWVS